MHHVCILRATYTKQRSPHLELPHQELLAWVNEIAELSREQMGAGGVHGARPEPGHAPPDQVLAAGWEALMGVAEDGGSPLSLPRSQDLAPLFSQVLQDGSGATAEQKAAAWAGMAVCALLEGNVDGAKDLVVSAQKAAPNDLVSHQEWAAKFVVCVL